MSNHSNYPKKAGIYKLTCNDKVYIGKAVNIYNRICGHKSCEKKLTGRYHLQHAIIKYGWDAFDVEVLEVFENFDKLKDNKTLLEKESYYIKLYDSSNRDKGYNICKFSNDSTGKIVSQETREKLSRVHLGKVTSEETKEKIRQGNLGKILSEETKEKIRQTKLAHPMSEEAREHLRNCYLGKPRSEETKEKIRQTKLKNKLNK